MTVSNLVHEPGFDLTTVPLLCGTSKLIFNTIYGIRYGNHFLELKLKSGNVGEYYR